ncbi:unnamed protein product, partial [Nesidiocoris tenuis]
MKIGLRLTPEILTHKTREQCGQEIKHPGSCNWPPGVNSLLTNSKTSLDELDQISENEDTFCKLCTDQNQYENQSIRIQTAKSWPYTIQLLVEELQIKFTTV